MQLVAIFSLTLLLLVLDIRMRRYLAQNVLFFVDNENIIVITSWSADAALLSAGFWPAELVLSPGLVS